MKIITLCGSLKFQKEMMEIAEKVALEENCILTPVYPVLDNIKRTEEQLVKLKEAHFKRIELSDAILVINVNNYIGNSTNNVIINESINPLMIVLTIGITVIFMILTTIRYEKKELV